MDEREREDLIIEALQKQTPLPAQKHELGGDYYYRCYWVSCNADVKSYDRYCPMCGQRLLFD